MQPTQATQRTQPIQARVIEDPNTPAPSAVPALKPTPTLPAVATLPATIALAIVAADPATATLPRVAALPATAALYLVAALPATAVLATVAVDPATADSSLKAPGRAALPAGCGSAPGTQPRRCRRGFGDRRQGSPTSSGQC